MNLVRTIDLKARLSNGEVRYVPADGIYWDNACDVIGFSRATKSIYRRHFGIDDEILTLEQFEFLSLAKQFCTKPGNQFSRFTFSAIADEVYKQADQLEMDRHQALKVWMLTEFGIKPHTIRTERQT
jgi:hypothetical protein